jgi:hypothetical protein
MAFSAHADMGKTRADGYSHPQRALETRDAPSEMQRRTHQGRWDNIRQNRIDVRAERQNAMSGHYGSESAYPEQMHIERRSDQRGVLLR